ncbi:MAG: hypothetical protein QF685_07095 [Verrucomicrobiota bacterium]|nr:hypothetical protein [Verrucomicrobiota bacterium]
MRAIKFTLLAAVALPTFLTGCFTTQDGKSKFTTIPWRTDSIQRRYDRPVEKVLAATRESLSMLGTLTSEEKTKNVITGRIDTRYIWIKVTPDKQAPESISAVTFQVRTKYRNPDIQIAANLAQQTTLALINAENAENAAATSP